MRRKAKKVAIPRPVDFANNDDDLEAAILGEAGWHVSAIARTTGLTESQVSYRKTAAGVKSANYRNGKSPLAKHVLGLVRSHTLRDRMAETRLIPATIENLQGRYVEHSSIWKSAQKEQRTEHAKRKH